MRLTRTIWLAAAAVLALGCGEGRAIFNVDVLSFEPSLADTVPYVVPGGTSITGVRDSFAIGLPPGLGNASVVSVSVLYGSTVLDSAGSGKFKLEIFFSSDSTTIFSSTVRFADSATLSGSGTPKPLGPISVPLFADSLFAQDKLWVGVRASLTANAGPALAGRFVTVSVLGLRIVLQDHLFQ